MGICVTAPRRAARALVVHLIGILRLICARLWAKREREVEGLMTPDKEVREKEWSWSSMLDWSTGISDIENRSSTLVPVAVSPLYLIILFLFGRETQGRKKKRHEWTGTAQEGAEGVL